MRRAISFGDADLDIDRKAVGRPECRFMVRLGGREPDLPE
jgi:hypothetical protein